MTLPEAALQPILEGNLEEAAQILRAHLTQHADDRAATLELSRVLLGLKQFDQAHELFSPLLEQSPQDGDLLGLRGLWNEVQQQNDDAKKDYIAALKHQPDLSYVLYNLGRLLVHQDQLSEEDARQAEEYLSRAIAIEEDHFQAQFELAALYTRLNRPQDAIEACRRTIEINPFHIKSYLFLGELFTMAGDIDGVIQLYKAGLLNNPLVHAFRDELIRLYRIKGSLEKALDVALEQSRLRAAYEDFLELGNLALQTSQPRIAEIAFIKAAEVRPNEWRASYNLGELYRGAHQPEEAQKAYTRSLECVSTSFAHTGLGLLAFEQDEPLLDKAIEHFQKAFSLESENPTYLHNLALALHKAGKSDELKKVIELAEQIIPPEQELLKKAKALLT